MPNDPTLVTSLPKCLAIAEAGVESTDDLIRLMAAVQADVAARRVTTQMAGAIISSGRVQLAAAHLRLKHGRTGTLALGSGAPANAAAE